MLKMHVLPFSSRVWRLTPQNSDSGVGPVSTSHAPSISGGHPFSEAKLLLGSSSIDPGNRMYYSEDLSMTVAANYLHLCVPPNLM